MAVGRLPVLLGGILACACGGAAGPGPATGGARAPATEQSAMAQPVAEPAGETGEPAAEKPAADAPAPEASLTDKDVAAALQSLFGDPQLVEHLHLGSPGRSPLKVHGDRLPAKLDVIVGSHQVKVVPEPGSKKDAVMVFTKIERDGDRIKLHYRYDIEGIDGRATVTLKDGRWELTANRVVEK